MSTAERRLKPRKHGLTYRMLLTELGRERGQLRNLRALEQRGPCVPGWLTTAIAESEQRVREREHELLIRRAIDEEFALEDEGLVRIRV